MLDTAELVSLKGFIFTTPYTKSTHWLPEYQAHALRIDFHIKLIAAPLIFSTLLGITKHNTKLALRIRLLEYGHVCDDDNKNTFYVCNILLLRLASFFAITITKNKTNQQQNSIDVKSNKNKVVRQVCVCMCGYGVNLLTFLSFFFYFKNKKKRKFPVFSYKINKKNETTQPNINKKVARVNNHDIIVYVCVCVYWLILIHFFLLFILLLFFVLYA